MTLPKLAAQAWYLALEKSWKIVMSTRAVLHVQANFFPSYLTQFCCICLPTFICKSVHFLFYTLLSLLTQLNRRPHPEQIFW